MIKSAKTNAFQRVKQAASFMIVAQLAVSSQAVIAAETSADMLHNKYLPIASSFNISNADLVDAAVLSSHANGTMAGTTRLERASTSILNTSALSKSETATIEPNNELSFGPLPIPILSPRPASLTAPLVVEGGAIVIDNDEAEEVQQTIKYEEMATDAGGTRIKAGARFPIVMQSELNSKNTKNGEVFQARLKYDLKIGDRLIAKKGSLVTGHVNYVLRARTNMCALLTTQRFLRNSGTLGFQFDELINEKGEHIPLVAMPARMARIVKNKAEGRELGVNYKGQIAGPFSTQVRYKAIRVGLNIALSPAGVFSFGAMPVALGVIGAANPSFAFGKPVGQNVRNRRIKGFAWGFLSGFPGSFLIEDTTVKGQEAIIKPGDEFLAEMNKEFTGEPQTDATLMPGATTKVQGQVVKPKKK